MEALLYCCCGLDVHRDVVEACILCGTKDKPEKIRASFGTTRPQLRLLTQWMAQNDCYNVAMESTGVYWKPIYHAIECCSPYLESIWVVNANHMRNLPGRKSDVADAEWIATLLRHGLLEKSFVPPLDIQNLRECSRLHQSFVQEKCRYINRLEKFLQAHGFKFSSVMSDPLCVSGRKLLYLLRDNGSITLEDVEQNCRRIRKPTTKIAEAVCGEINIAEQRILKQLLRKIDSAQADIESILEDMRCLVDPYREQIDIIDSVPGFDEESSMKLMAEISAVPDEYFSSHEKLCSWAGLSPRNDESAGKIKSRKIMHGNRYVKAILCQTAWAAVRVRNSPFHAWFWSRCRKIGKKKAIIAVARKLLKLIYILLQRKQVYSPTKAI